MRQKSARTRCRALVLLAASSLAAKPLTLGFIANIGQNPAGILFTAKSQGHEIALTRDGLQFRSGSQIARFVFPAANPAVSVEGLDAQSARFHYLRSADPSQWHSDAPAYRRVRYHRVFPGVDLEYYLAGVQLEYDFLVSPGADAHAIAIAFEGIGVPRVTPQGDLLFAGGFRLLAPQAYQETGGVRHPIASRFVLEGGNRAVFHLGSYDRSLPLVIDPAIAFATYFGGSSDEQSYAVATDLAGNSYIAGYTSSGDFPVSTGAYKTNPPGGTYDAFVAKFSPAGTLLSATYLGGSGNDVAYGIAVDSAGNAYLTGSTTSSDFPVTIGTYRNAYQGGNSDAFVAVLNAAGNGLIYSTYFGGTGSDVGYSIALDRNDEATIAGSTTSTDMPATLGVYGPANGGGVSDGFVVRFNTAGTALIFSTYLGGAGEDAAYGVAVDTSGNAYVTGYTSSTNFPTTQGVAQRTLAGGYDAFVTVLNPFATAPLYSTLLGGSQQDYGAAIAVDKNGNAYLTGYSASPDYPTTSNTLQAKPAGGYDVILSKLTPLGALAYSTYFGGSGDDYGLALAIDPAGNVYLTGDTDSPNFPVTPTQTSAPGLFSAFAAQVNAEANGLGYSTLVGGSGFETGYGIALDSSGNALVTGYTVSADFPVTAGVAQGTLAGGSDAFLVKLAATPALTLAKQADAATVNAGSSMGFTLTASNAAAGAANATNVALNDPLPAGTGVAWSVDSAFSGPGTCAISGTAGAQTLTCSFGSLAPGASAAVHVLTATSLSSCQNYTNTATLTADNAPSTGASATSTVKCPALAVSGPASLPGGTVYIAYASTTVTAAGGNPPYTWMAAALPPGLSIGLHTGAISGTPTTATGSPFNATVTVTDNNQATANRLYSIAIAPAPACDLQHHGIVAIADVQSILNQALGLSKAANDLTGDGLLTIADVQIEIDAALNLGCGAK